LLAIPTSRRGGFAHRGRDRCRISFGVFADRGVALARWIRVSVISPSMPKLPKVRRKYSRFRRQQIATPKLTSSTPAGLWSLFERALPNWRRLPPEFSAQLSGRDALQVRLMVRSRNFEAGTCCCHANFKETAFQLASLESPGRSPDDSTIPARTQRLEVPHCRYRGPGWPRPSFPGPFRVGKHHRRLWLAQPNIRILSDDRIILRQRRKNLDRRRWHGDAGISLTTSRQSLAFYFLERYQARRNSAAVVSLTAEYSRAALPASLSKKGLEFALSFIERVAREIPITIFRFLPPTQRRGDVAMRAIENVTRPGTA